MEKTLKSKSRIKTILAYSIPSIISMLLTTAVTVTDAFFVGNHVGEEALAAINLGLPVLYLFLGVGLCTGVGGSVIAGHLIGKEENQKASEAFTECMVTSLLLCCITCILLYIFFSPVMKFLNADGALSEYFESYYLIMLFTYPLLVLTAVSGMFIRTDGKPQLFMAISVFGCILNFILDYLFVSVLGLGVAGSAYASLTVEILSVLMCLGYFVFKADRLRLTRFRHDGKIMKAMILNGSSEFIGEAASAISMFAFNYVLMKYTGVEGVAAFTILGYAVYAFSMITIGFGQGLCPIVSVLWGKGEIREAEAMRNITVRILVITGLYFSLLLTISGKQYALFFGAGESAASEVATGFRIMAVTFPVMGFDVTSSMYFTAIGDASSSALVSSLRGLILLLPLTLLFPMIWGLNGVWLVTPVTECLTAIVACSLLRRDRIRR
ncbi:MAG: MATE family efflux transporter [Bullifex sp.]